MRLRLIFALLVGRLVRRACRLMHRGGTDLPGRFVYRLCPDALTALAEDVTTVAVTGTNGKTTSARMIAQAFEELGLSYFSNQAGANLITGIITEYMMHATWTGKPKCSCAVIECDEAAAKKVFGQIQPRVVLVTNLFRDQLDRYGEVSHTLENLRIAIAAAPDAALCLNADCALTASLALDTANHVVWYGMEQGVITPRPGPKLSDARYCIRCKTEYQYDYITYGHLGGFRCPHCGYRRRTPDVSVTGARRKGLDGTQMTLRIGDREISAFLNLPAVYNIYNAAGMAAVICAMGLSADAVAPALAQVQSGFGRMERFPLGQKGARMILVKNPEGCNQALGFLADMPEHFILVLCLNDRSADGTDISWIWDADFEALQPKVPQLDRVIVAGDRAEELQVRLKYAEIPEDRIRVEQDHAALVRELGQAEVPILMLPTYTAMLELRRAVIKACGGTEFWE